MHYNIGRNFSHALKEIMRIVPHCDPFIFNIVNCKNNMWRCNGNWFHKINGSEDIIVVCAFCTLLALKAVQFRNVTCGDKLKETFVEICIENGFQDVAQTAKILQMTWMIKLHQS